MAKTFDGPPTLEPYGRDLGLGYRVRTLPLGFLSPTRGTEGVVKTIEERLGEKGKTLLAGETER